MTQFIDTEAKQNILFTSFQKKLLESNVDRFARDELLVKAAETITNEVYPAYQQLIDHFKQLKPLTNDK